MRSCDDRFMIVMSSALARSEIYQVHVAAIVAVIGIR
jgi:hypothetical protein